jgi:hypothetical protein
MFDYHLEHIMSFVAMLGNREIIGSVPEGIRVNVEIAGGEVAGPKVFGKLTSRGGDWITVRRDGILMIDVRATIETRDGALIYLTYTGISDLGENGYDQFATAARQSTSLRMCPRFHTSNPNYTWLNRLHCFGIGQSFPDKSEVAYDIYAVR